MRPRRQQQAPAPPDAVIREEAERLAGRARLRLRGVVNGSDPGPFREVAQRRDRALAEIVQLADPIDRLRAYIELGEELTPSLPADCARYTLPVGKWWLQRLGELEGAAA